MVWYFVYKILRVIVQCWVFLNVQVLFCEEEDRWRRRKYVYKFGIYLKEVVLFKLGGFKGYFVGLLVRLKGFVIIWEVGGGNFEKIKR